ncbi:MAG: NUDIX hydrolase [Polyangiales bacterium]
MGAVVLLGVAGASGATGGATGERAPSVLLIQRGRPPLQGTWTLPGGRVERGEGVTAALRREVREETGLDVEVGALVEVVELVDPAGAYHFVILDHVARPVDPASPEPRAGDDAADARWVALTELSRYALTEAVLRVIERAARLPPW